MKVLLWDIIDLFSGTIRVSYQDREDIFRGSKDDFWDDPNVQDFMAAYNVGANDIYVQFMESDDNYGGVDTIHVDIDFL